MSRCSVHCFELCRHWKRQQTRPELLRIAVSFSYSISSFSQLLQNTRGKASCPSLDSRTSQTCFLHVLSDSPVHTWVVLHCAGLTDRNRLLIAQIFFVPTIQLQETR